MDIETLEALRTRMGGWLLRGTFEGLSRAGKLHPRFRRPLDACRVERDIVYGDGTARTLDVYRAKAANAPQPALLYLHGGAFRILSKDTHWIMAAMFAQAGYTVFNANYRLAPQHKFPAALDDAASAYEWVVANAERYGADASRLVIAGESAGANLALATTLAACFERPEPFARRVFATGQVPRAVIPMCGILQVSEAERFARRKPHMRRLVADRLRSTEAAYIGGLSLSEDAALLADPLCLLESSAEAKRPLPPMFAGVGTADPLLDDTRRLAASLQRRGVAHEVQYYPNELHAFHALTWRAQAQRCWAEQLAFLSAHVPA